jgi:RimJ/RimL family protein N-acetyltransferase
MAHPYWPLFDLEVHTPRVTLRYVDDVLSAELARLASNGVHEPGYMPFSIPWTDAPSPQLERNAMQFHWRTRAETTPDAWRIPFATIVEDTVVGSTDLTSARFPILRQFETGSWLGREYQGQGIGKEMRLATLAVGFDGLGAEWATTAAWTDNAPSLGVTRSLGYDETGRQRDVRQGNADEQLQFRMSAAHFATIRRDDIGISGLAPVREFLGL